MMVRTMTEKMRSCPAMPILATAMRRYKTEAMPRGPNRRDLFLECPAFCNLMKNIENLNHFRFFADS
jgi:hypothetical protein